MVEDYYALADIETLLCQMEGYEVKTAKTGEEGLELIESYNPDLVILDLMLPGELSGSQVLQRIRSNGQEEPKVLVVSALVNQTTTAGAREVRQRAGAEEAVQGQGAGKPRPRHGGALGSTTAHGPPAGGAEPH